MNRFDGDIIIISAIMIIMFSLYVVIGITLPVQETIDSSYGWMNEDCVQLPTASTRIC